MLFFVGRERGYVQHMINYNIKRGEDEGGY